MDPSIAPSAAPVPPTEVRSELDGSHLELTDIPIQPLTYPVAPNKVLRKQQLADVPRAQRGTLLGLCYDLFVEQTSQPLPTERGTGGCG
jgi:alpha-D-ribose 1-methylphosphonate 5-triphosphate synthase subunit PhnI